MNQIFQFVSTNLILVGIVFFLVSSEKTALIPAIMGIVIQFNILMSNKFNKFHKHFAHLSLIILILGAYATYGSVIHIYDFQINDIDIVGKKISEERSLTELVVASQFLAFVYFMCGIIYGIKSFIDARKN